MDIREDYVMVNPPATDAATVITLLASKLHADGAVSADYGAQTIQREEEHPTGLPTSPIAIAIPHAGALGVHRSSVAVALLVQPVMFRNMGDPEEELPVEIVLLLANRDPEGQVTALRQLATLFGQSEQLLELRSLTSPGDIAKWLQRKIYPND